MDLLIQNATLCDSGGVRKGDLLIRDGVIASPDTKPGEHCQVIDAAGLYALPAFADMHCHFRDPGFTQKEDIETGSMAAAAGGYTAVNAMANTNPVCSSPETIRYTEEKAQEIGLIDLHQTASLTENFDGKTIDHLNHLPKTTRFVSDDGNGVMSNKTMEQAMRLCKEKGLTVLSHAEDSEISPYDYRLAENIATARDILLCEYTGARLHMCHVSTKEAMEYIIAARRRRAPVTCEVGPHHIYYADLDYRVNPPIRQREDAEFLQAAIRMGFVDCIATDHAPHTEEDKKNGAPGMVGLETAFAACFTALCVQGGMPLADLVKVMSENPQKMMGRNAGKLQPGMLGDIVLVDLEAVYTIDRDKLHSKSKNTPFHGETVQGRVEKTIKGGKVTYTRKQL